MKNNKVDTMHSSKYSSLSGFNVYENNLKYGMYKPERKKNSH